MPTTDSSKYIPEKKELSVLKSELLVSNAGCKRGNDYAIGEITDPRRMVASTTRVANGRHSLVPVYTSEPFPKQKIMDLLKILRDVKLVAPVKVGQVVLVDVLGTGIDVVASRDI